MDSWDFVNILRTLSGQTNSEYYAEKVLNLVQYLPESSRDLHDESFFRRIMEPNLTFVSKTIEQIRKWLENYAESKE